MVSGGVHPGQQAQSHPDWHGLGLPWTGSDQYPVQNQRTGRSLGNGACTGARGLSGRGPSPGGSGEASGTERAVEGPGLTSVLATQKQCCSSGKAWAPAQPSPCHQATGSGRRAEGERKALGSG